MNEAILVIAAHADDEALGCGKTIAQYVAEGCSVHVVFIADGITSRPAVKPGALQAQAILGGRQTRSLGLPDNRIDTLSLLEVVQQLEPILDEVRPHLVYTHHYGDLNVDHRITHQAVLTACRPVPCHSVKEIRCLKCHRVLNGVLRRVHRSSPTLHGHQRLYGRQTDGARGLQRKDERCSALAQCRAHRGVGASPRVLRWAAGSRSVHTLRRIC